MRLALVVAALVLGLIASPAAAQDARVYVPGGDGGRYVKLIDPKTRVTGYAPAAVQAFRGAMSAVLAQLDAMPEVNTPPPGICHQLGSWIEVSGALDARVLGGEVDVMRPLEYRDGRCIKTNNALVMLGLNKPRDLVERSSATVPDAEGQDGRHWYVLPAGTRIAPGRIEIVRGSRRVVALTRRDVALFIPVTAERYLIEELRRAGDAPTDPRPDGWRRQLVQARGTDVAACLRAGDLRGGLDLAGGCPADRTVVEMNPAFFDARRPGELQLLTLVTPVRGDNLSEPSRQAIWGALDMGRLAALVR